MIVAVDLAAGATGGVDCFAAGGTGALIVGIADVVAVGILEDVRADAGAAGIHGANIVVITSRVGQLAAGTAGCICRFTTGCGGALVVRVTDAVAIGILKDV